MSRRLPLYAGGDLPMDIAEEVAMHLTGCPDCLSRLRLFQADRERLAALQAERLQVARPLAGDAFWAGVEAGIRPVPLVAGQPVLRARGWQRRGPLAAAAALLLALGLGAWVALRDGDDAPGGALEFVKETPNLTAGLPGPKAPPVEPAFVPLRPVASQDVQFALGDAPGAPRGGHGHDDIDSRDDIVPALVDFNDYDAPGGAVEPDEMHYPLDDLVPALRQEHHLRLVAAEQGIDF